MVLDPFYDFYLSSLKLCCKGLTFPLRMSRSLPIFIASPFFFQNLMQIIKFFNSFCCTLIVLGGIKYLIVFLSQLLHIQTVGDIQGC